MDNGCTSTSTGLASVYDVPVATFDIAGDVGCNPFSVEFNAYSSTTNIADTQLTYFWDFDDGTFSTVQSPVHLYDPEGTYNPSLTIALGTCQGFEEMTKSMTVSVLPTPTPGLSLSPNQVSIYNPIVTITDQSVGADTCLLIIIPGDTLTICDFQHNYFNPNSGYTDTVTHFITQIVTNSFGCSDTLVVQLDVLPEYIFFAPNSFTPNDDGFNDLFFGKGFGIVSFEMYIYDRWGDLVFHTKDKNQAWSGHVNNGKKIAQEDVYVYMVFITDIYKSEHKVVGHITLIR
jgi:gliding motility-associated-like protein